MNLTSLMVAVGAVFLPLGVYFMIEGTSDMDTIIGLLFSIGGMFILLTAILLVFREEQKAKEEKQTIEAKNEERFQQINDTLTGILNALNTPKERQTNERKRNKPKQ